MEIKEPQPLVPGGKFPTMTNEDLANRFKSHPAKDEDTAKNHELVRTTCYLLAVELNNVVPDGREKALAITNLEEVMFWANAGIARKS
jgi:hypothetical protein